MKTRSLDYDLPAELIAQNPPRIRTRSQLLVMNRAKNTLTDRKFEDVIEYINPGDCLVLNDTRVLPARFYAKRLTGAKLEGLFISEQRPSTWEVMLKNARRVKQGDLLTINDRRGGDFCQGRAIDRTADGQWRIELLCPLNLDQILEKIGFAPLPPYIKRDSDSKTAESDLKRYQTVYARRRGAIAAPTAGLHFTEKLIGKLKAKPVRLAYVTLHVGAGTFKPVTCEELEDHDIHSEIYGLDEENARIINDSIEKQKRIIAVGTTSVRTLETIAQGRKVSAEKGSTKLFIKPGYDFKVVDAMITNFHLPRSTLIALVGAFAGMEDILKAYRHAIEKKYRFYSYGDAMLII